ncbi:MAG: peptide ligase PGM1-related protein [Acidobacteriota bacterium]
MVALEALPDASARRRFAALQERLLPLFERQFSDRNAPRTVVVLPSLTLDEDTLSKIHGVPHYEERMLCLLLLLRLPRTRVVYLSSLPISESIVDYYLHLLPGIPSVHAKRRLTLISCHDASHHPLAGKLLERPRLLDRVRSAIGDPSKCHMSCFTVTDLERRLALELQVPIYGCDPDLSDWGSKSGSRKLFREAGLDLPAGSEDLRDEQDVVSALVELARERPDLRKAVVKHNDGFSGAGNALFTFPTERSGAAIGEALRTSLRYDDPDERHDTYFAKFEEMQGIVEEFVAGSGKESPSAQMRIDPSGHVEVVSTHDQVLSGPNGQEFSGCTFPAAPDYRLEIQEQGRRVGEALAAKGVIGRFAVDFLSIPESDGWRHVAIEVNLRKGGTTHPFLVLQFLTDGHYDDETGLFLTPSGEPRYYYASDNVRSDGLQGLTPLDLIDVAVERDLLFHGSRQTGLFLHLIGAASEFGKLGMVCIAESAEKAAATYQRSLDSLAGPVD